MRPNKLRLLPDKTVVLLVGPDLPLGNGHPWILDRIADPRKAHVHSLGVLLGPVLCLDVQMATVARRTFHQRQLVCQL